MLKQVIIDEYNEYWNVVKDPKITLTIVLFKYKFDVCLRIKFKTQI